MANLGTFKMNGNKTESKLEQTFISTNGEKTFENDDSLPSLPIPSLNDTLQRYLDSVKPHLSKNEFENTKSIVDKFEHGIGKELHEKLVEKSAGMKNWLEKMWEDEGYLALRMPINLISMCGILTIEEKTWPFCDGVDITRAAFMVHAYLDLCIQLRKEKIKPQKHGKTNFSMYQWKRIFNTCRIPGESMDKLSTRFKTENEGDIPRNIVVFMNGHVFSFEAIGANDRILTVAELECQFNRIREECEKMPAGPGLSALTAEERTTWSKNRKHLIDLDSKNEVYLGLIQNSLMNVNFFEKKTTQDELLHENVFGDCKNRWFDKASNINVFKNGAIISSADHMPADGMVMVNVMQYANFHVLESNSRKLDASYEIQPIDPPKRLEFVIDNQIKSAISDAAESHKKRGSAVEFVTKKFEDYGKGFMKQQKIHPDTFVQLVLQLAYYRIHKKFAPTYETAATRQYYNGRTETLRACTPESCKWVQAMVDDNVAAEEKLLLLKEAYIKHMKLMADGMNGQGCDRHLFGIYQVAKKEGLPIPDIYKDKAWKKSGGDGNFILSTSLAGYSHQGGGTIPMCDNGYGVFYNITEECVNFCISSYTINSETDAQKYFQSLCESFELVKQLLS